MNKKKLEKARRKIDKIDNAIFNLIKKRSHIVKYMLSLKKYKNQIIDHKRIKVILKKIKEQSKNKKIDTQITEAIWKAMIRAFINYEFRNFTKK